MNDVVKVSSHSNRVPNRDSQWNLALWLSLQICRYKECWRSLRKTEQVRTILPKSRLDFRCYFARGRLPTWGKSKELNKKTSGLLHFITNQTARSVNCNCKRQVMEAIISWLWLCFKTREVGGGCTHASEVDKTTPKHLLYIPLIAQQPQSLDKKCLLGVTKRSYLIFFVFILDRNKLWLAFKIL
jgi:hypothetical protein